MDEDRRDLGIVLHSGSYDRVYNALLVGLTALALGRQVRLLFTYWSLEYLLRDRPKDLPLDLEAKEHRRIIEKNIAQGRMQGINELLDSVRELEGIVYTCVGSMTVVGITRAQLSDQVDDVIGMAQFLRETGRGQLLFV